MLFRSEVMTNYLTFDTTKATGRLALLDALASDAVEIAEGIEPLRDPRFRQKGRLNAAIVRSKFMQTFVEFKSNEALPQTVEHVVR